jgi:hypothetical protein
MPVVLSEADLTRIALEIGRCEQAALRWEKDMGGMTPLSAHGEFTGDHTPHFERQLMARQGTAGKWANWRGPYLQSFIIRDYWPRAYFVGSIGPLYDLDGDGKHDLPKRWAMEISISDVSVGQWEQLENLLEPEMPGSASERQASGRVKWRPSTLTVLVASEH